MVDKVFVTKANGTKQLFEKEKIVRTCLRMGATRDVARIVAKSVEKQVYNDIETRGILRMLQKELGKYKPSVKYRICLRRALSLMKPKPDFERFIQILLEEHGYQVSPSQVVRGKCVDHELDAIAKKHGKTHIVEVKHHYNYHTPTGLDESRIARAVFEDITEGFESGMNSLKIDGIMIVCNTKFSQHARRYAKCRGIQRISWGSYPNYSLQTMIEEKKLYPVSCIKGLSTKTSEKLASAGIILVKQLATQSPEKLGRRIKIPRNILVQVIRKAGMMLSEG